MEHSHQSDQRPSPTPVKVVFQLDAAKAALPMNVLGFADSP